MKKLSIVLRCASSSLVVIVALAFTVLEATLLITLDFVLYENQIVALVQFILRLLISSSALTLGILSLVKITRSFLPHSICLLISSVSMIPFVSNNIAGYFTAVAMLFMLSELLFSRMQG